MYNEFFVIYIGSFDTPSTELRVSSHRLHRCTQKVRVRALPGWCSGDHCTP